MGACGCGCVKRRGDRSPRVEENQDRSLSVEENESGMQARSLSVEENQESDRDLEDLDPDMWGMTVMTITKDFADIMFALRHCRSPGLYKVFRFCYGASCQALNVGMQLVLLWYVHLYVVKPSVVGIQADYKSFHADVFDPDGTFRNDLWHLWTARSEDLCNAAMTKLTFTTVVMILWTTRMLGEFRGAWRLWGQVMRLPSLPAGVEASDMVSTVAGEDGGDVSHIVYLNCGTRLMLLLVVVVPKAFVCVILWFIGCRWLNATESFNDLILNALALEFIISTDEIILTNFFPDRIDKDIEATKFAYPKEATVKDEEAKLDNQEASAYIRSMVFAVMVFGWCYMYLNHWQQVLPGFSKDIGVHCHEDWFMSKFELLCLPFDFSCFPYGPTDGESLPEALVEDGDNDARKLQALNVTVASLLAEIALLPSVV